MDTGVASESGEEEPKCTKAKCTSCCKSFTGFLFSTVGLVLMVVAYSIAGGFLFQSIEEGEEERRVLVGRMKANVSTKHHLEKLWEITNRLNILYPENWTAEAEIVFANYQEELYNATTKFNWDGKSVESEVITKWNFAGALLYAVTAITTIGYGHVTPKTGWGMGCTMLYCLFGLPLTLMCIANLGKFFSRVFRVIYHTCCCGICCICCLSYRKNRITRKLTKRINENGEPGDLESLGKGQSLVITNDPSSGGKQSKRKHSSVSISKAQVWMLNVKKKFSLSMRDDVTIPVYLCLVVMAAYIMGGALIFALWDGWDYLTGAYFCFVTLTTIGFGDYVPGVAGGQEGEEATLRLILCSLYVFLGLALVGMCIDLMQADVLQKLWWIAAKLGIVSKNKKIQITGKTISVKRKSKYAKGQNDGHKAGPMEIHETNTPSKIPLLSDSPDPQTMQTDVTNPSVEYELEHPKKTSKKSKKDKRLKKKMDKHNSQRANGSIDVSNGIKSDNNFPDSCVDKTLTNHEHKPKQNGNQHTTTDYHSKSDTATAVIEDFKLDEQFLCLPPPDYAETASKSVTNLSSPTTPASHYDDLPSHISNITPEHQRLQDVDDHQPIKTLPDFGHSPSSGKLKECLGSDVRPSSQSSDKGGLKMVMEEDSEGELLLTVDKAPH